MYEGVPDDAEGEDTVQSLPGLRPFPAFPSLLMATDRRKP